MTEPEWLALDRVNAPHMDWLRRRGTSRQFFLAAAAWARQVEMRMSGPLFRSLLQSVERFADGHLSSHELSRELREAEDVYYERHNELQRLRLTPADVNRQLAADVAAIQAADPHDGWTAAINALKAAGRIGKRDIRNPEQAAILHDIFANPFHPITIDPTWRTATATTLAQTMYDTRDFAAMPILADALEDAGCEHPEILIHSRGPTPHVRGCWVIDQVLGKS